MAGQDSTSSKPRLLSISGDHYDYQLDDRWPRPPAVQILRLRGYWLSRAGFSAGQRVEVYVTNQCLVIVPAA